MLIQKRMTVVFLETACEALLLSVVLIVLSRPYGPSHWGFVKDLSFGFFAIFTIFFTTGYLLTTAIVGTYWRSQRLWLYPAVATVLFFIHSQIFFVIASGSTRPEKLLIQTSGACIAFACTFVGSCLLRKWLSIRVNPR